MNRWVLGGPIVGPARGHPGDGVSNGLAIVGVFVDFWSVTELQIDDRRVASPFGPGHQIAAIGVRPTFAAVPLSPDGEIRGIEVVSGEDVVAPHQRCDVTFKDRE